MVPKFVTAHILLARFISPLLQLSKTVAKNSEDGVLPIKYEQLPKFHSSAWLSDLIGISVNALEKKRIYFPESLPPHYKIGRRVLYREDEVLEWLNSCRVTN